MRKSDINPMPEYFDRYINLVGDVELLDAFDDGIERLEKLDLNLLERLDGVRYAPGKWTAKEILQHVTDWERILTYRALLFARREGSIPQGIDETTLAAQTNADRRTFGDLIDELKTVRHATRKMFASFDDETLLCTGTNWKSEMSVLALGFAVAGHQIHHLDIIREKYFPLAEKQI